MGFWDGSDLKLGEDEDYLDGDVVDCYDNDHVWKYKWSEKSC